jgi:uncharacterized protein (TIGR02001 family)
LGSPSTSSFAVACLIIAGISMPSFAAAVTIEGDVTYTSDYIYRGISQTGGHSAGQLDLHLMTADGTFFGVFASTLTRVWQGEYETFGWHYELEEYLGHRFDLSPAWNTTVTAVNYSYLDGNVNASVDHQELSAALSYLDLGTATVSFIPNAVRYQGAYRLGRYPAFITDLAAQLPIAGRLFLIAGAGYYTSDSRGYAYGNVGLGFEFKSLRIEGGYYGAQERAQALFPYGRAGNRFAGSVSWRF